MMMMEGCRASGGKHGHTSVFCRSEAFFFFLRYLLSRTRILKYRGASSDPYLRPCCFFGTMLREEKLCRTRMLPARTLILRWFPGKPDATCPRGKEETKRRRQPCSPRKPTLVLVRGEAGGKVGEGREGETWALCVMLRRCFRRATTCDEIPVLIPPHSFHLF